MHRQRSEKKTENKQCERDRDRENANLSSYTKIVLGSGDDLVITDDENITLNLLRNALGGPASHLQLQSFYYRPGLHAQQQWQKQQQEWTCRQPELGIHDRNWREEISLDQKKKKKKKNKKKKNTHHPTLILGGGGGGGGGP